MTLSQWVTFLGPMLAIVLSRLWSHSEHLNTQKAAETTAGTISRIEVNTNDRLSKALGKVDLLEQQVRALTAVLGRVVPNVTAEALAPDVPSVPTVIVLPPVPVPPVTGT